MGREVARSSRTGSASGVGVNAEVEVSDTAVLLALTGPNSELIKVLGDETGVSVGLRGNSILLAGDAERVALAERFIGQAAALVRSGTTLDANDYVRGLRSLAADPSLYLRQMFDEVVLITPRHRPITPKGLAQKRYIESIRTHDLTFCIGPAGTGKTYLAMAMAISGLMSRAYKRIILARPAVEAGEKLGFLPGDLAEKVNPYLRPLYDALHDMMDIERVEGMVARGQIEVAPLAFMRGRTLNDCFVILDEAQNSTSEQMRMFLTRLGYASKAVVTGDVTQVDLPPAAKSGLAEAKGLLGGIEGIAFCALTEVDVVRHPLVQKIIVAYEKRDSRKASETPRPETKSSPPSRPD
jgi:phosphate starvation-inducible protein PhoH and related proteins